MALERTLVIVKPDAVNRGLIGEIIHRFERKGLKIIGLKMVHLKDEVLHEHYAHHRGKPFFKDLVDFMKLSPTILIVLEGNEAVSVVRKITGPTFGVEAPPGTIRGDFAISISHNVVHASDSPETAKKEIKRFFKKRELFPYERIDWNILYSKEDLS